MAFIDLHVHSNASDGTETPAGVVELAAKAGLIAIALTDHDTVQGVEEALENSKSKDILTIPGVELSAVYQNRDIHILGYSIDYKNPGFLSVLDRYQEARADRNRKMIRKMADLGFDISEEKVEREFPGAVLTRAHFARYLLNHGYVKSNKEAFERYLDAGKPCYLPKALITPREAMDAIRNAGGHPVLAHPMLYRLGAEELDKLVAYLKELGLEGIETYYSSNTKQEEKRTKALGKKYGLFLTGGSDFHGSNKPAISIGTGKGNLHIPEELLQNVL
ncbi:PHP domain-containing protein [Cuneatibacter caecimuris]|uniref:Polymerase/histidinol phosphatase N-terminal domain-containing protein n=1 Tax=Cuneatibacter caecimuris TaxID=1796618 RepID=A0A4Q7NZL0_9FIRM|nr:PHP domain-containing protein [Cuneatibacter caecimuris]RZS92784.1 hypothetical protein EV209_2855 [Cuneatibacter caecimuris]